MWTRQTPQQVARAKTICVAAAVVAVFLATNASAVSVATWDGGNATWTDAAHWSTTPVFPNNNGGNLYDAVINGGAVALNQNITIDRFLLGGGSLEGTPALMSYTLAVLEGMQWTGGSIRGSGFLALGNAGPTNITGAAAALVLSERTIDNSGPATFTTGTISGGSGATLNNLTGATFTMLGGANFFADIANPGYTINNAGTFTARSTNGAGFSTIDAVFNNSGTLRVENSGASHTLSLAGGGTLGNGIDLASQTSLELGGNTTLQSGLNITGAGTAIVAGSVVVSGSISGRNLGVAVGELNVGAQLVSVSASAKQSGGTIRLGGGTLRVNGGLGALLVDDGTLVGTGTLDASLNTQGITSPGAPLGTLSIANDATFGIDAHLTIEIGGTSAGLFDLLAVGDATLLGGVLNVVLVNGFTPGASDTFTILTAPGGRSGFFSNALVDGARFPTSDGTGSFIIDYTPNSVVLMNFVPEPSGGVLLAAGGLLCARRRRRR